MFRSRKLRAALALCVLIAAVAGGLVWRHHQRYKHFAVHEPGMMYRSAWLEPDVLSEVIETYQLRSVVNLCRPGEMGEQRWEEERKAVSNAGARLIELPMSTSIKVDTKLIRQHLEVLADPNNYPMLVHCQHGVTRTAKILSIYDIAFRGKTAEESLKAQPLFGRDDHNVNIKTFVFNFEKEHRRHFPTMTAERLKVLCY